MQIPADLWSNPRPEHLIDFLERRQLDLVVPAQLPLFGQIDGTDFIRVKEIGRIQSSDKLLDERISPQRCAEDLLAGLYGLGVTLAYLVIGKPDEIAIYLGLRGAAKYGRRGDTLLHNALNGLFPGIQLDDRPEETHRLGEKLRNAGFFAHQGMMTGIPSLKQPAEQAFTECPWDHLLRGLCGEVWGCFVLAKPMEIYEVVQAARLISEGRRLYSSHAGEQVQKAPGVTVEIKGGPAYDALKLLERTQERLEIAKAEGMWKVESHFFSPSEITVRKMASLLRSAFAGEESRPEPIRTLLCSSGGSSLEQLITVLNSRELAILIQLPQEEKPGYAVRALARFDVSFSEHPIEQAITVGRVLDGRRDTGNVYAIERANLAKHVLIAGVTGSGKTNTCFHLLDQVWQRGNGVPFLVIEPAKAEYRDLLKARDERGQLIFPRLRVFTLGNERVAPFRLNPFEFEILDEEHGTHVQTHIDHLKSVFNASFIFYAPMPYVLERCLHEVYRDRGWDMATGVNRRVPTRVRGALPPEVFPTMTDLYDKIAEVVDALGYEERIRMDIRAALETRINSLRIGGKGLMLDTRRSVPMEELLARPTILELESIGDDDEKAFVIGLLLTRLYEYRVAQAKQWRTKGHKLPALQHVTVIEEAHRLLRHVSIEAHPEVANVRGKAVETFANMLAEIRAYGEGIIVAEQIPAKLASDVIKNTNLKVLHRLVAEDDRQLVGDTMNLDEAQKRFVTTLNTGQAAVFAEGDDRPFLVAVDEHLATKSKGQIADRDVAALMRTFCTGDVYDPYSACPKHCQAMAANANRCPYHVRDRARSIADQPSVQGTLAVWVLSIVEDAKQFIGAYPVLRDNMRRLLIGHLRDEKDVLLCATVQGIDLFFERKMRQYDWLLNVTNALKAWILAATADLVQQYESKSPESNRQIMDRHRDTLERFSKGYQQQCKRDIGPYPSCELCTRKCLYRYEVQRVVGNRLLQDRLLQALRGDYDHQDGATRDDAMWQQVCWVCLDAARQVIITGDENVLRRVALCYAVQVGAALGFSLAGQTRLARGVANWI